jgi:Homeodomain-like domain
MALTGCSSRRAEELTQAARRAAVEAVVAERRAEMRAKEAEGKTVRAIAEETGVSPATVSRVLNDVSRARPAPGKQPPAPHLRSLTALHWWALTLALGAVSVGSISLTTSGPVAWSARVTALAMLATAGLLLVMP